MFSFIYENTKIKKYLPHIGILSTVGLTGLGLNHFYNKTNDNTPNLKVTTTQNLNTKEQSTNVTPNLNTNDNEKLAAQNYPIYQEYLKRKDALSKDYEAAKKIYGLNDEQLHNELNFWNASPDYADKMKDIIDSSLFSDRYNLYSDREYMRDRAKERGESYNLSPVDLFKFRDKPTTDNQEPPDPSNPYRIYPNIEITNDLINTKRQIRDSNDLVFADIYPREMIDLAKRRDELENLKSNFE